jgi:hypothetical protein
MQYRGDAFVDRRETEHHAQGMENIRRPTFVLHASMAVGGNGDGPF